MGRHKTIDRNHVLEVAEEIIGSRGAAALTIDAVAKAAGITKGGVQSCFGTKEVLIAAMLKRWIGDYEQQFDKIAGEGATPVERVAAHVETTHRHDDGSHSRVVGLLAALLQTPEHLAETRHWYERRLDGLDLNTDEARRARLAFLATEGVVLLRFLGLVPLTSGQWDDIFKDIKTLIAENA